MEATSSASGRRRNALRPAIRRRPSSSKDLVNSVSTNPGGTQAVAFRRRAVAFDHDRSFEYYDSLLDIVIPVELAFGAGPDPGRCSAVPAGRNHVKGPRMT